MEHFKTHLISHITDQKEEELRANAFRVRSLLRHYENYEQYRQAMNDKISKAAGLLGEPRICC